MRWNGVLIKKPSPPIASIARPISSATVSGEPTNWMPASKPFLRKLPQRLAAAPLSELVERSLLAVRRQMRQRRIKVEAGKINVGDGANGRQRGFDKTGRIDQALIPRVRFIVGFSKKRIDQEQHLHVVRIAPGGDGMAAHIVAVRPHAVYSVANRNDRIGVPRRERPPARRAAGLDEKPACPAASAPCSAAREP